MEAIRTFFKTQQRRAYLGPEHNGYCFVYDSVSDDQDIEEIERLGQQLSKELDCRILSALNHDDDYLILRLFAGGNLLGTYDHFWDGFIFSCQLTYYLRRWLSWPLIALSLTFPFCLFQYIRHSCLARCLGLPPWAVGVGYGYIRKNDLPYGMDQSQFDLL